MKMFKRVFLLVLLFACGYTTQVLASQCALPDESINAKDGFCISFTLDANGTNRLRIEHKNRYYPLWTDDSDYQRYSPAFFERAYVGQGKKRTFQIKFTPTSNTNARWIIGTLRYYVDGVLKSTKSNFDLSAATQADKFDPSIVFSFIGNAGTPSDYCVSSGDCAEKLDYSANAKYEFGVKQCESMPCTIPFHEDYEFTPLVFVMPTIDAKEQDKDAPSKLYIASELSPASTSVTINQASLPNLSSSFKTIPMRSISYLIIEPGTALIGNHQVVAGYVNTNKYHSKNGSTGEQSVSYSSFGGGNYGNNPVVLHQIQTRNNSDQWMTSGRYWDNKGHRSSQVRLFLELSASRDKWHTYKSEKIAFLATKASGVLDTDDYYLQFKNDFETIQQSNKHPMEDGCEKRFAKTDLRYVDGIIAKKQERAGSHGGWLRTCETRDNQFSLVIDEDYPDRSHIPERVGYVAFERKKFKIDYCEYFPQPAQSWKEDSEIDFKSYKSTSGRFPYFIGGWSNDYVEKYLSSGKLYVPFGEVKHNGGDNDSRNKYSCEHGRCEESYYRVPRPTTLSPAFSESVDLDLGSWNYAEKCPSDNSGEHCSSSVDGQGNIHITIKSDLKSLKVQGISSSKKMFVYFSAKVGRYGRLIEKYEANGNVHSMFVEPGSYTFKEIKFNSPTDLTTGKDIVWNVVDKIDFSNSINLTNTKTSDDFLIFAPDADVKFSTVNGDFYALILADEIDLNNNITIFGAVTTNELEIDTNNATIVGQSQCISPSDPEISAIKIEPQNIYLQCESNVVYVDVSTVSGDAIEDIGDTRVVLESAGNIFGFSNGTFDPDKQRFKFDITSKSNNNYGEFKVDAYLAGNPNIKDTNHLIYSPVAFKFNDGEVKQLIAGKQDSLSVQVLACADDSNTVTGNYSKTFSQSDLRNTDFLPGAWAGNETKLSFAAEIKNGQADATIQFNEAGEYTGTLKDVVSCDAFKQAGVTPLDCPEGESKEINGILKFKARPWTFAVCDSDLTALPSGDISNVSSAGFTAAGDKFDIAILPIRWQSGGSVTGSIATQDSYCNNSQVTVNFAKGEAGTLQIPLAHSLTLPSGGEVGSLSGTTSKSYLDDVNGYYLFNDLSWNEVGQIQLQASTGSYLGMAIQPGYKTVGRFYPKYFKISDLSPATWTYATGQTFNYMNQPFEGVTFTVDAADAAGQPTLNYHSFPQELRAKFVLHDSSNRLMSPVIESNAWNNTTRSLGEYEGASSGSCGDSSSLCWQKLPTAPGYEDGPFNLLESGDEDFTAVTNIAIIDGGSVDPVEIKTGEGKLTVQPDLRFGRASLSSVGGVVSDSGIKVPLRLEYWNGSRFITNSDDSNTEVKGSNLVASNNVLWSDVEPPAVPAEVSLSGGGSVEEGLSHSIIAKQDKLERQQTQVWLELIDANNDLPWLQYLWDTDSGAEGNPSTVVTFGIYRGNDKIIFRGESGLTGQ